MSGIETIFYNLLLDLLSLHKGINNLKMEFSVERSNYKGQNIILSVYLCNEKIKQYPIASFLNEDKTTVIHEINVCLLYIYDKLRKSFNGNKLEFLHVCFNCGSVFSHPSKKFEVIKCDNCLHKTFTDIKNCQKDKNTLDIYFFQSKLNGLIKIGVSGNYKRRLKQLEMAQGCDLVPLCIIKGRQQIEAELHKMFDEYREKGEWFTPGEKLLTFIEKLNSLEKDENNFFYEETLLKVCRELNIA